MEKAGKKASYFTTLCLLAWPAILEQLLLTAVNYVDTAMVGSLGYQATAAVAINIPVTWVVNGLVMGVSTGYSVQAAYGVGAGDKERTRLVIRQAVTGVLAVGGAFTLAGTALSAVIPRLLGGAAEILPDACGYLRIYMLSQVFVVGTAVFSAIHRCMGNTKFPLWVNVGANLMNVVLNFFFIFESRPAVVFGRSMVIPGAGLGVTGASLATGISLAISCLILAGGLFARRDGYKICCRESFRPEGTVVREAVRLGLPLALERLAMSSGQLVMTRVVAGLGTVSLAANQISVTAESLCYLPAHGISYAATALVGQSVGAEDETSALSYGKVAVAVGFFFSCITAAAIFAGAGLLSGLFTDSEETARLAARMLRIVAVSEPFLCAYLVASGVLRGAGDVRYPMIVSLIGMWLVRIPAAPVLAFPLSMGLTGVWLGMALDQVVKGILCLKRVREGRWVHLIAISQNGQKSVIKN